MIEYKGVSNGNKLEIDGEKLFIKGSIVKERCYLAHIEYLVLRPVNLQGRGILVIVTDDKDVIWQIVFKRDQYDTFKEAYEFLLPYTRRMIIDKDKEQITILNKGNDDKIKKPINKVNVSNPYTYVNFDDISGYEVISDVPQIINNSALTNAAGGKYVAGDLGALAGLLSSLGNGTFINNLQIKLNLKSIDNPCVMINYITRKTEVTSQMGKYLMDMFQKDVSRIAEILRLNSAPEPEIKQEEKPDNSLAYDELKKLKELLDADIITQDEFNAKKKQLLGL